MRSATTVKGVTKMGLKVKAVTAGIVGAGSLFTLPLQTLAADIAANDNVHQPEVILEEIAPSALARAMALSGDRELEVTFGQVLHSAEKNIKLPGETEVAAASAAGEVSFREERFSGKIPGKRAVVDVPALQSANDSVSTDEVSFSEQLITTDAVLTQADISLSTTNQVNPTARSGKESVLTEVTYTEDISVNTSKVQVTDILSDGVVANAAAREVIFEVKPAEAGAVSAVDWASSAGDIRLYANAATEVVFREINANADATAPVAETSAVEVVKPEAAQARSGRYVIISNVEFEGNEVVDDSILKSVSQPFIGRRIGLSDLEELRVQLTQAYVDRGYLNSGALLPDQKVEAGNIVYQIVEGEVSEVNIEGEGDLREKYIAERILKDATEPFNALQLQENFQLLLDDPLIERMDGQLQSCLLYTSPSPRDS